MLRGFISYSHKDKKFCEELQKCFSGFKRENRAVFWSDHAIDAGEQWYSAITSQIEQCDIAVLLLSRDFYNSDFVWQHELPLIKARWDQGKLTIVSIRIRACYDPKASMYQWLRSSQQIPRDDRDIASSSNRDKAWKDVTVEMSRVLEKIEALRAAKIENGNGVEATTNRVRLALNDAFEIAKQLPETIDTVARDDIHSALQTIKSTLDTTPVLLRDEVAVAHARLRRCDFDREEHARMYTALAALKADLLELYEVAKASGFPATREGGMPNPTLVPREQILDKSARVEAKIEVLEAQAKGLDDHKLGTAENEVHDAAIQNVVDRVDQHGTVAKSLLSEERIDVDGVQIAIKGANTATELFSTWASSFAEKPLVTSAERLKRMSNDLLAESRQLAAEMPSKNQTEGEYAKTYEAQAFEALLALAKEDRQAALELLEAFRQRLNEPETTNLKQQPFDKKADSYNILLRKRYILQLISQSNRIQTFAEIEGAVRKKYPSMDLNAITAQLARLFAEGRIGKVGKDRYYRTAFTFEYLENLEKEIESRKRS